MRTVPMVKTVMVVAGMAAGMVVESVTELDSVGAQVVLVALVVIT